MSSYDTRVSKPINHQDFEEKASVLFRELLADPNLKRFGRSGQGQEGIDLLGKRNGNGRRLVGVQCKLKGDKEKVTEKELRDHIKAAVTFKPKLSEYIFISTAPDDTKLDKLAAAFAQRQRNNGRKIDIVVWGWEALQARINESDAAKRAFDPGFSPALDAQNELLRTVVSGQEQQATKQQIESLSAKLDSRLSVDAANLPTSFADRELKSGLELALRRRGFAEANWLAEVSALAQRAIDGELSLGSLAVRIDIIARAARANAAEETLAQARQFRAAVIALDPDNRDEFYEALVMDAVGRSGQALQLLRKQDNPNSRTTIFNHLGRVGGAKAAIDWLVSNELDSKDLNAAGVINLLLRRLEMGQFDEALRDSELIPAQHYSVCPVLHWLKANFLVASILPADQKAQIFQALPMNPRLLQLASDAAGLEQIRRAQTEIVAVLAVMPSLGLRQMPSIVEEVALWLRLEDPVTKEEATAKIASDISDPKLTLQRVRLALAYNVPFNVEALERHLRSQKAVGGWTTDELVAALSIAFRSGDAKKLALFFDENHDEIFSNHQLAHTPLAGMEIEILARAGRFEDSRRRFAQHEGQHLDVDEAAHVREIVDAIQSGSELERLRRRYAQSTQLTDLRFLVAELAQAKNQRELAEYAPVLAQQTRRIEDFRVAAGALFNEQLYDDLLELFESLPQLYALDNDFEGLRGWALFKTGRILEARQLARDLYQKRGNANDRELAINTSIETGDWGYLQAVITHEVARIGEHDARTLIRLARLALEIESPYVDAFRDAALVKSPDDAHVLLAVYNLALERGLEQHDQLAYDCFEKAIRLSGPKGPVQSVSFKDLIDRSTAWNQQVSKVDEMLREAKTPLFVAARALNRQPLDMYLGQAIRNISESDPRAVSPILAFSGARTQPDASGVNRIALDFSAIVTLHYLGLLRATLDHFEVVSIAPTTLSAFFIERQFLRFGQVSEIAKARRIEQLIAAGKLRVLPPERDHAKAEKIDCEEGLASMLLAAARDKAVVVRSAPVFRAGSYLEEVADLSKYAGVLADTHAVIAYLSGAGKIEVGVKKNANVFLGQVDKGWESGRAIDSQSTLYLDDVSVSYLYHVGVLQTLVGSVKAIYVSADVDQRAKALIRYSGLGEDFLSGIEGIQQTLQSAIERGKVQFCRRRNEADDEEEEADKEETELLPTLELLADLSAVDAVFVDDRLLNGLPFWADQKGHRAPTFSSLDILSVLHSAGGLTQDELWNARHKLRVAGYYAVPTDEAELVSRISWAPVHEGVLRETPELRAIRESITLAIRADVFLLNEEHWFNCVRLAFFQAIRTIWLPSNVTVYTEVQATWLLCAVPEPLAWCSRPADARIWALASQKQTAQLGYLFFALIRDREIQARYTAWLGDHVVKRLETRFQWLFDQVVEFLKSMYGQVLEEVSGPPLQRKIAAAMTLNPLPSIIRGALLRDPVFRTKVGFDPEFSFPLDGSTVVSMTSLHSAIRAALAGRKNARLVLKDGSKRSAELSKGGDGSVKLLLSKNGYSFSDADLLSRNKSQRLRALCRVLRQRLFSAPDERRWRAIMKKRGLSDQEFVELMTQMGLTPEDVKRRLAQPQRVSFGTLVPDSVEYFESLVGPRSREKELATYINGPLRSYRSDMLRRSARLGLRRIAYSGLAFSLIPSDELKGIDIRAVEGLLEAEDPFSLLFGFQIAAQRVSANKRYVALGVRFLDELFKDQERLESRCTLFSACAVAAVVKARALFNEQETPLHWFRLAALTHAGVLTDALRDMRKPKGFLDWVTGELGLEYLWHGIVDRADAPRWVPEWIDADHIEAELIGQAANAVGRVPAKKRPAVWVKAVKVQLDRLQKEKRALLAFLPGPMDDFGPVERPILRNPGFLSVEAKLKRTRKFIDIPGLPALAYFDHPTESALSDMVRLLEASRRDLGKLDERQRSRLALYAQAAATNRSVPLATALIDRCLRLVRLRGPSPGDVVYLFNAMITSCAAQDDHQAYWDMVKDTAVKMAYSVKDDEAVYQQLRAIFRALERRDSRMIAYLGRATAIVEANQLRF
ncbi:MAG: hypothetical protein GC129_03730 [Proteobacteria bacterium]|nr:hypothetical protein [Pseudomonadota bacterium]